ncbi:hypothetical protein FRC19_008529 [Serendipita sp. 401]|nr:hypothetical protein FRC19_008529 [Serendipita sp. 401]
MENSIAARQLLHVWPSLKHLAVRSSSLGISPLGENEPSPPFSLFEFRWEGMHAASKNTLLWILNYDDAILTKSYLRILHLSAFPQDDLDQDLAGYYGRHLHSLRIPSPNRFLIESTIQLREMYLLKDEDLTKPLLLSLPRTIEHIAFSVMKGGAQAIENLLKLKEATGRYPRSTTVRQFDRMAAAVNDPLRIYASPLEEDPPLLTPPPSGGAKSSSRESVEGTLTNSRSTTHPRGTPHQQTIHLDAPYYVPRAWDYDYDRPIERIRLDDPSNDISPRKHDKWKVVRRSLHALKGKISSTSEK